MNCKSHLDVPNWDNFYREYGQLYNTCECNNKPKISDRCPKCGGRWAYGVDRVYCANCNIRVFFKNQDVSKPKCDDKYIDA